MTATTALSILRPIKKKLAGSVSIPDTFTFDGQAADFDRRAGIPAAAAARIAAAVEALAAAGGVVLDVGAGTGEIGSILARSRYPYMGLDLSLPMLAAYGRKLAGSAGQLLVRADADRRWPIAPTRAGIVFLSRAAHLLRPQHLAAEALRVARPGGVLILGRVRRDPASVRAEMRRQMRRLLAGHGVEGRGGERARRRLAAAFEERGAAVVPPRQAASWSVVERPADSLAAWRRKPGLAGQAISREIQDDVLHHLELWALERYGGLDSVHRALESYELTVVHLHPVAVDPGT